MKPKRHLILMTGTPITTPEDVYGYCRLTNPTAYASKSFFEALHVGGRDMFDAVTSWKREDLLSENFLFNSARAFRREIDPDLPEVTYEPIIYELNPDHMEAYKKLAEMELLEVEGREIDMTTIQKLNTTLQQIIIGYEEYFETPEERSRARKMVVGFDLLEEVMRSLGDRKLIVFAYYKKAIEALKGFGSKYGAVAVYGGMSDGQRNQALDRFVNDSDCRLLVGQPLSMGSGLDTLKDVCSDILFLELPMVAKDFEQAVGRIDRNGQKNHCHVRIAVAEGTLQGRRQKTLLDKDQTANKVQMSHRDLRDWIFGDE